MWSLKYGTMSMNYVTGGDESLELGQQITKRYLLLLTKPLLIFWDGGYSLLTSKLQKLLFCDSLRGAQLYFIALLSTSRCCCVFEQFSFSGLAFTFGRVTPNESLTAGAMRATFKDWIKCSVSNVCAAILVTVTFRFPVYFIAQNRFSVS